MRKGNELPLIYVQNISWSLHNYIAWIKTKPLLQRWASLFYIVTLTLVQPYWILEITANVSNDAALYICRLSSWTR